MELVALQTITAGSGFSHVTIVSGDRFNTDDYPVIKQAEWDLWLRKGVVRLPRSRGKTEGFIDPAGDAVDTL